MPTKNPQLKTPNNQADLHPPTHPPNADLKPPKANLKSTITQFETHGHTNLKPMATRSETTATQSQS